MNPEYPWAVIDETIERVVETGKTSWLDEEGNPLEWPIRINYRGEVSPVPHFHEDLKTLQDLVLPLLEGEYGWVICYAHHEHGWRVNILTQEGPSTTGFHESLAAAIALALYTALV